MSEHALPLVDVELLVRLRELEAGDTSGVLARMVRQYLSSIPPQLERMRELLLTGQAGSLAYEAHGLAGSSAMYGLPRLRQHSKELEACAKSQRLERARQLLAELERTLAEARPLLLAELSIPEE